MANMKWHDELDIFRKIKPCIILEGNVLDRFHYPDDSPERNRDLADFVYCYLKKHGYGAIAYYDPSSGFYAPDYSSEIEKMCARVSGGSFKNCYMKSQFVGTRLKKKDGSDSEMPAIGEVLSAILAQTDVASAVIIDMASRLIIAPDSMDECEVKAFASIQRAIRKSKNIILPNNESTKNLLILIVNKVNDLPAWFYFDNPDVKTIQVSTPDAEARRGFISDSRLAAFFHPEIWERDRELTEISPNKEAVEKMIGRFVGLTEGYSYSDLIGMRSLCRNERFGVMELPKLVDLYRFGIRENKWNAVSRDTVAGLEKDLTDKLIGQDLAKRKVLDVIKRSVVQKHGVSNRPKGVLFFAGPTGTGKTETAKILAQRIFGDQSCCIRFDMSEYRQDQSDQKLLGAPPGYVGYESGGQLTNAVRNRPFSILLFDEIEKAHPSIMDKFLQILDDGRLTDGQGNTVYFSESIIIFTSNKGIIEEVQERDKDGNVRIAKKQIVDPEKNTPEEVQQIVIASITDYFKNKLGRPELLNRIGENNIVVFDFIRPDNALKILELQKKEQLGSIRNDMGITVEIGEQAQADLEWHACSKNVLDNGGRGIRTLVENRLYTPITRYIFDHGVSSGQTIIVNGISGGSSAFDPVELDAEVKF